MNLCLHCDGSEIHTALHDPSGRTMISDTSAQEEKWASKCKLKPWLGEWLFLGFDHKQMRTD